MKTINKNNLLSPSEFWAASSPLTLSLTVFGQFVEESETFVEDSKGEKNVFIVEGEARRCFEVEKRKLTLKEKLRSWRIKFIRFYSIFVGVLLWINSLRKFFYFRKEDKLGLIMFWKLAGMTWCVTAALNHLGLVVATTTSKKLKEAPSCFLREEGRLESIRKIGTRISVTAWLIMISYVSLDSFILFYSESFNEFRGLFSFAGDDKRFELAFNASVILLNIFSAASMTFPLALFIHLALLFTGEVTRFNDTFVECIESNSSRGVEDLETSSDGFRPWSSLDDPQEEKADDANQSRSFSGPNGNTNIRRGMIEEENVEFILRRHKVLESSISKLDSFTCWCLGVNSTGHSTLVVLMLFVAVWNSSGTGTASTISNMLKIIWSAVGLVTCAVGGVITSNAVGEIYSNIQGLELSRLHLSTLSKLILFSSGRDTKGLTVFKIFVLDRNAVLTIVGFLVSFFLLVIQLLPSITSP